MSPLTGATRLLITILLVQAFGAGQEPQRSASQPRLLVARQAPGSSSAQQPARAPAPPAQTQKPALPPLADPELQKREEELQKKEQSQRILGVIPQFGVTNRRDAPPLSEEQKFRLFVKTAFDPVQFAIVGFQAGLGQAENSFAEYGQGVAGYAKRYGAAFADQVSSGFFSNFAYPVLLKEDPRYFRLGEGTIRRRVLYSLAQEFVCRTDKGTRRFNFSNILGAFTAGGISNVYYPPPNRGFGLTMSRSGISLLYGSLGGLVDEFWPDIDRKFFHRKKNAGGGTTTQPSPSH